MAIRMIAADLDGTLLDPGKSISARTESAVKAAIGAGALFVLNSGRMPESMAGYAAQLNVNAPIICFNGALTYDARTKRESARIPLGRDSAITILRMAEDMGLYIQGFWGHHFYCAEYTDKTAFYEDKAGVIAQVTGEPLSGILPGDVYKLLVIVDPGQMREILPRFVRAFGEEANCAASSDTFIEIVSRDANKGAALRALGASRGVAPSEILAFGDELNDLSMLTMAGYGYAMANAPEEVRRRTRLVAPSNAEDGLAQVLERYLAEGLLEAPREVERA